MLAAPATAPLPDHRPTVSTEATTVRVVQCAPVGRAAPVALVVWAVRVVPQCQGWREDLTNS